MSRILFVSTSTTLGGAEKTVHSLATRLDPKQFTVTGVVGLKPPGAYAQRLAAQGVTTLTLGMRARPGLAELRRLSEIIEQHRPDIVHAVMYQAIQLCRLAKRRSGVAFKLVSSPRVSYRTRGALTLLVDRFLKNADNLLIAECEASRDYLIRRLGYSPRKVRTIYNGVDVPRGPIPEADRRRQRLELGLGPEDVLLGTVGRLDAQKGQSVLIDAVARLKGSPLAQCVIIGEGPLRARLEAQIRRLSLEKRVRLLGERADAPAWLASLDLFVLPSLWEGLPNSLLEAMALGLPAVASAVDGIPEVVADGRNGRLVPPKNPAALAKTIAGLIADPAVRARLGQAARTTITERFTFAAMLSGYETAYTELLAR